MFRNGTEIITGESMNFVLNHGALGDVVCSLPAIIHARLSHNARLKMTVWAPAAQNELLRHLLAPYGEFTVKPMSEFPLKAAQRADWGGGPVAMNAPPFDTHTRNRVHMVDFAFNFLLDAQPESMAERSYPVLAPLDSVSKFGFPDHPYVVIPVGATSLNKLFKAHVMEPVIRWIYDRGYTPVLVGTKVSHTVALNGTDAPEQLVIVDEIGKLPETVINMCFDLREKTTLLELRDILGHAEAVVGVDGGTLHLAGTTDTNIVYAMGTTLPKHRFIARFGDPNHKIRYVAPRNLECTGCQSRMTLMFGHNFRHCIYKDNKCMDLLHPEDFINGMEQLGL